MKSPFPGMDPFIEACGLWEDFHSHLIESIAQALVDRVPAQYVVRTGERGYMVLTDENQSEQTHGFKPDVGVTSRTPSRGDTTGAAVLKEAAADTEVLTLRALVAEEFRETFVEIYALEPQRRLVTCIEVLSPSNKRKGTPGWEQYQRKRQALLMGEANLVEIDLLRGGQRMPMIDPWPDRAYFLLVSRRARTPYCQGLPGHYRHGPPTLPVPLDPPDPDVSLDLQAMVDAIYTRYRYARDIDYARALMPPLTAEDATWLSESIRERNLSVDPGPSPYTRPSP